MIATRQAPASSRWSLVLLFACCLVVLHEVYSQDTATIQSGLLTASDIDDNLNFGHYLAYQARTLAAKRQDQQKEDSQNSSQEVHTSLPNPTLEDRVEVRVKDVNGNPFSCAQVRVVGGDDEDNNDGSHNYLSTGTNGRIYLFPEFDNFIVKPADGDEADATTWNLQARPSSDEFDDGDNAVCKDGSCITEIATDDTTNATTTRTFLEMQIPQVSRLPDKLDLALIIDTTGSMCDELRYLQTELSSVINTVVDDTAAVAAGDERSEMISVRVAIILYRDNGDAYVVRKTDFTTIDDAVNKLGDAGCDGGGDYPEAMVRQQSLPDDSSVNTYVDSCCQSLLNCWYLSAHFMFV